MVDMKVRMAGLQRCCVKSLAEYLDRISTKPKPGASIDCAYEPEGNRNMVVDEDGVWVWNNPVRRQAS